MRLIYTAGLLAASALSLLGSDAQSVDRYSGRPTISVSVLGAVKNPMLAVIPEHSSLIAALAASGGLSSSAKSESVDVLRGPAGQKLEKNVYNVKLILGGSAPNVELKEGDIVFVEERLY